MEYKCINIEEFSARTVAKYCFARAEEYYSYCQIEQQYGSDAQITVKFPDTNGIFIYPINNCTCDD